MSHPKKAENALSAAIRVRKAVSAVTFRTVWRILAFELPQMLSLLARPSHPDLPQV